MNCKPGDLAFIIRSDFPENIGLIVRVVSWGGMLRHRSGGALSLWNVEAQGSPLRGKWLSSGVVSSERVSLVPDQDLRPIRPEPELLPAPPVAVTA